MSNTSFLVLGAGELGMSVLRALASRAASSPDTTVTVLLRPSTIDSDDPDKQRNLAELRSLGVSFLSADLVASSTAELSTIFKDFDTVISCTGYLSGPGFQLKLTHAVLDAGVRRHIPWQFGVNYDVIGRGSAHDLFDEQLGVRDLLRSQDLTEWSIVSTGIFTSYLFAPFFGLVDLEHNSVHALGTWDNAITVTAAEDIGVLTAEICFAEPRVVDGFVYTAGDTLTYARLADIVDSVLDRTVRRVEWNVPELKSELEKDPDDPIKKYRVVFAEGRGVSWSLDRTFNDQMGIEVIDAEQWARKNLR